MKRIGNLYNAFISDGNILMAIREVNRTHRTKFGKLNPTVKRIEMDLDKAVQQLRELVVNDFKPSPTKEKVIWDNSAQKERIIHEPPLWPDQYIHHMLIQVLQPVMMRGMDYWCCASIRGRGIKRGKQGLERWIRKDLKETRYAAELDIYHFYESLKPEVVIKRMRQLIKDKKILSFIEKIIAPGISIGAYFSQWFANTVLSPLDHYIREQLHIKYYMRYMDNLILFCNNKTYLHSVVRKISLFLEQIGLRIKRNWQIYPVDKRLVAGLGYRYNRKFTLIKKRSFLKLKRANNKILKKLIHKKRISFHEAAGLLSRIGQIKHCNNKGIYKKWLSFHIINEMKRIISESRRRLNDRIQFQYCKN